MKTLNNYSLAATAHIRSSSLLRILLNLKVVFLYYVVVHDLLLLECEFHLIHSDILIDNRLRHVSKGCMSGEIKELHDDDDPEDVLDLEETEALLEDPAAVHAEERVWHIESAQVEHSIFNIESILYTLNLCVFDPSTHESFRVYSILQSIGLCVCSQLSEHPIELLCEEDVFLDLTSLLGLCHL